MLHWLGWLQPVSDTRIASSLTLCWRQQKRFKVKVLRVTLTELLRLYIANGHDEFTECHINRPWSGFFGVRLTCAACYVKGIGIIIDFCLWKVEWKSCVSFNIHVLTVCFFCVVIWVCSLNSAFQRRWIAKVLKSSFKSVLYFFWEFD